MRYVKQFSLILAAMLTVGVLSAGSASGAIRPGTVDMYVDWDGPCNIDFNWNDSTGDMTQVHNTSPCPTLLSPVPGLPPGPYTMDIVSTNLDMNFSGGSVTIQGAWTQRTLGFINCTYSTSVLGALEGEYSDDSGVRFFYTEPQDVAKTGGPSVCQATLPDLQFFDGVIQL